MPKLLSRVSRLARALGISFSLLPNERRLPSRNGWMVACYAAKAKPAI